MTLFALSSSTVLGAGILDPQPGLAFWFLITFILVAAVLRWKVWGPLASTIEEREKSIQSAIDQAKLEREQAEKLLTEQKVAAEAARKETAKLVRRNQLEVEKAKEQMLAQAQAEAMRPAGHSSSGKISMPTPLGAAEPASTRARWSASFMIGWVWAGSVAKWWSLSHCPSAEAPNSRRNRS